MATLLCSDKAGESQDIPNLLAALASRVVENTSALQPVIPSDEGVPLSLHVRDLEKIPCKIMLQNDPTIPESDTSAHESFDFDSLVRTGQGKHVIRERFERNKSSQQHGIGYRTDLRNLTTGYSDGSEVQASNRKCLNFCFTRSFRVELVHSLTYMAQNTGM